MLIYGSSGIGNSVEIRWRPEWKLAIVTTKNKCVIEGLDSTRYYCFRVNAVCAAGISGFSDPAICRVAA